MTRLVAVLTFVRVFFGGDASSALWQGALAAVGAAMLAIRRETAPAAREDQEEEEPPHEPAANLEGEQDNIEEPTVAARDLDRMVAGARDAPGRTEFRSADETRIFSTRQDLISDSEDEVDSSLTVTNAGAAKYASRSM